MRAATRLLPIRGQGYWRVLFVLFFWFNLFALKVLIRLKLLRQALNSTNQVVETSKKLLHTLQYQRIQSSEEILPSFPKYTITVFSPQKESELEKLTYSLSRNLVEVKCHQSINDLLFVDTDLVIFPASDCNGGYKKLNVTEKYRIKNYLKEGGKLCCIGDGTKLLVELELLHFKVIFRQFNNTTDTILLNNEKIEVLLNGQVPLFILKEHQKNQVTVCAVRGDKNFPTIISTPVDKGSALLIGPRLELTEGKEYYYGILINDFLKK